MQNEYSALKAFIDRIIEVKDEEWKLHRDTLSRKFLRKGEFLLQAGEVCEYVSFVNIGLFRVFTMVNDEEVTNHFFFENNYATEYSSFLTRQPSTESIQAMEDAEVLQLNYKNMQVLYEKAPSWQKYGRLVAEYIFIMAADRAKSLLLYSPEQLYLKVINETPELIERVPLQYIASYLGVQPESLSRIRKRVMELKKA